MFYPSLEEIIAKAHSGEYKIAPICMEIYADVKTPIEVMRILQNNSNHCYMLESVADREKWGRYTFLGFNPTLEITCFDGDMKIGDRHFKTSNPKEHIQKILDEHKSVTFPNLPSFTGGLVGYFSYDYLKYSEPTLHLDAQDNEGFKDVDLMLFDKVICFDNFRQKIILIGNISLDNAQSEYDKMKAELESLADLIRFGTPKKDKKGKLLSEITPNFNKERYCEMVNRAKQYIKDGDIFQIVLSNQLSADYEGTLFDTYRVLRTVNPSPYMFYFSSSDMEVAGASPETLVKLQDGILHTFPLAGTRPRGVTPEQDKEYELSLLQDEKELAEHNMLVDLGRNDIGKISKFGTVEVEKYHSIEKYSHVMHIGSTVRGEIAENFTALDAVDAVLPAGTLSGAPKIRACQIINDLENIKRGIYGGAIGYLDFKGNLDCCIAIRIAYKKNDKVFIRSGAGIVADSVPENEFQECINKAKAVVSALKMAEEEL